MLSPDSITAMAEGSSGAPVFDPPPTKKRRRECHFDSRWLKEFRSEGIQRSNKGRALQNVVYWHGSLSHSNESEACKNKIITTIIHV